MRCISQVACIIALVGCGQKAAQPEVAKETATPEAGRLRYPQSVNPGDPENAVKDLKRIYWAMYEYRKKYKKLPLPNELQDTSKELLPGVKLEPEDFENPDNEYSEYDAVIGPPNAPYRFPYYSFPKPAPGSPLLEDYPPDHVWDKPVFPEKGEKFVWATTRIYLRTNMRLFPKYRSKSHYTGLYVVLWSDGTIEKVPYHKMLGHKFKGWRTLYPGQARMPKDAVSITEYWKEMNELLGTNNTWDED